MQKIIDRIDSIVTIEDNAGWIHDIPKIEMHPDDRLAITAMVTNARKELDCLKGWERFARASSIRTEAENYGIELTYTRAIEHLFPDFSSLNHALVEDLMGVRLQPSYIVSRINTLKHMALLWDDSEQENMAIWVEIPIAYPMILM